MLNNRTCDFVTIQVQNKPSLYDVKIDRKYVNRLEGLNYKKINNDTYKLLQNAALYNIKDISTSIKLECFVEDDINYYSYTVIENLLKISIQFRLFRLQQLLSSEMPHIKNHNINNNNNNIMKIHGKKMERNNICNISISKYNII
jgi:hypothetical protein